MLRAYICGIVNRVAVPYVVCVESPRTWRVVICTRVTVELLLLLVAMVTFLCWWSRDQYGWLSLNVFTLLFVLYSAHVWCKTSLFYSFINIIIIVTIISSMQSVSVVTPKPRDHEFDAWPRRSGLAAVG